MGQDRLIDGFLTDGIHIPHIAFFCEPKHGRKAGLVTGAVEAILIRRIWPGYILYIDCRLAGKGIVELSQDSGRILVKVVDMQICHNGDLLIQGGLSIQGDSLLISG